MSDFPRYVARIYCGGTFVGCGNFESIQDCKQFAIDDGMANKLIIYDLENNGKRQTIKIEPKEA